jgi:hypothetical protein
MALPSLLSVFTSAPYLHSGAAPTLSNADDRRAVERFLKSIDRSTEPFLNVSRPANLCGPTPP